MNAQSIRVPGQGRIYKRGAVWYLDYWVDGLRKQERGSADKSEALEVLAARKTDALRGDMGFEKKQIVHFSDFSKEYEKVKIASGMRSARSIKGYLKHLDGYFGQTPLSKVTPELVEAYRQKRMKQRVHGRKEGSLMKGSSVNRELAILKNLFGMAARQKKFRGDNPVKGLSYHPEQPRDYVLSREEIGRLLAAADDQTRQIIMIALNTGLRKGEILGLRWGQIDFQEGIISFARTKSTKFLRVPMNAKVLQILSAIERKTDFVFPGRWDRGHLNDIKQEFGDARTKAGLPELHFHDLRHCAGTYMSAAGIPLTTIQQILGHRDIRTTTRYINANDENRRKAVNALASLFDEPAESAGQETPGTNVGQGHSEEHLTQALSHN